MPETQGNQENDGFLTSVIALVEEVLARHGMLPPPVRDFKPERQDDLERAA